jgi:hypothetical protein
LHLRDRLRSIRVTPSDTEDRLGQTKLWISILIAVTVLSHAVPVLYRPMQKRLWPILEWGMYKESRPAGPIQANKLRVIGVTRKGESQPITPYLVGSSGLALRGLYTKPMWDGDSSAAQRLANRINRGREDPFVEIRLESEKYMVSDTGVVKQENPAIVYRVDPSEGR